MWALHLIISFVTESNPHAFLFFNNLQVLFISFSDILLSRVSIQILEEFSLRLFSIVFAKLLSKLLLLFGLWSDLKYSRNTLGSILSTFSFFPFILFTRFQKAVGFFSSANLIFSRSCSF